MEWLETLRFLNIKLINFSDFWELLLRFILNTVMMLVVVRQIYLRYSTRRNYTFSYIAVGEIVFLLCFLLGSIKLELGFALGLFAIFGIIRFRTDTMPFKQMTYLFVVIGISAINALANKKVSYAELLFTNAAIVVGLWMLERFLSRHHEGAIPIVYENISNINLDKYELLLADLKERTGFDITHFEITKIDYLRDVADITIYFNVNDNIYFESESNDNI